MNDWIFFATYRTSSTDVRALPTSFSELLLIISVLNPGPELLIPKISIPNVSSIDQALGLVYQGNSDGSFAVVRIWSGGLLVDYYDGYTNYDIYYR